MLTVSDYLVDYEKFIKENDPDFKLVGRDDVIDDLSHILVQNDASNILMFGETGVGMSSITKGLTSRKTDEEKPLSLDIASRRFTWLDVNKLFAIGDEAEITSTFQGILDNLKRSHNRVLVIDDFRDFLDGIESMSSKKLLNMMMGAVKKKDFQSIWICRKEHLTDVLSCHSDVKEVFTPREVKEPAKEEILSIAKALVPGLEAHHRIKIDPKATAEAVGLLTQYRGAMTFRAQPFRTLHLIDKAAGNKQLSVRNRAPGIDALERSLAGIVKEIKTASGDALPALKQRRAVCERDIAGKNAEWTQHRKSIRDLMASISDAEENLDKKRHELDAKLAEEAGKNEALQKNDKPLPETDARKDFMSSIGLSGFQSGFDSSFLNESKDVKSLREQIKIYETSIPKLNAQFASLSEKFASDITLTKEDIRKTFSDETGIPMKKLGVDETQKYLNAEIELSEMVFGQEEAVSAVAGAIRKARAGLKAPNKPIGSFLFIGPSGVGKTELAKALALFMHGDMRSFNKFDMSEYQDKSQASRLTGAPPGTVGYEEGGTLTNAVLRNPYSINCFDEIEKADSSVYDLFLQVFDEGRLTDNHGQTADFTNSVNICTTNFGGKHFLRDDITFEQANEVVQKAIYNGDEYFGEASPFRPEFLNRFTGIICFNKLSNEIVIKIANKKIKDIGNMVHTAKPHLSLDMAKDDVAEFSTAYYKDPAKGARSVAEVAIDRYIKDPLSDIILRDQLAQQMAQGDSEEEIEPEARTIRIRFNKASGVSITVESDAAPSAITIPPATNSNFPQPAPALAAAGPA